MNKEAVTSVIKSVIVGIIVASIVVGSLVIGFQGDRRHSAEREEKIINATLATACVFALPVIPTVGRKPSAVRYCFTQYGFPPPALIPPRDK